MSSSSSMLARALLRRAATRSAIRPLATMSSMTTTARSALMVSSNISSLRHFSANSTQLAGLLTRELEEESLNTLAMPADLAELKTKLEKDWRIVDDETHSVVKLFLKNAEPKVSLSFHCQDTTESEMMMNDEEEVEDVDVEEPPAALRFTVTVAKAGKTLVLTCLSDMGMAYVQRVAMSSAEVESIQMTGFADSLYQGPDFEELPEEVQESFHAYLHTDCGVTSDVAAFISMYADFKEQSEYVRWLKDVKGVLA